MLSLYCCKGLFVIHTLFQKLQRQLEFLEVQEEYIKDEQKNLKKEYLHAQEEVKRIQSVPLVIGQFLEAVDQNNGIVGSTTGQCLSRVRFVCFFFLLSTWIVSSLRLQLLCAHSVHH